MPIHSTHTRRVGHALAASGFALLTTLATSTSNAAAPAVTRLTPPSALFTFNDNTPPIIARFLPGQRFDLQATLVPTASGNTFTSVQFYVDGALLPNPVSQIPADKIGNGAQAASLRAYSNTTPGVHKFKVVAVQDDAQTVEASGNFEVVGISQQGRRAKNIIFMIGDGMGIAHRTAARIMLKGVQQGKANDPLVMDTFPNVALIQTASLNTIVTDSAPGASCYSSGNKNNNNQEGVFPDDTAADFDNPRTELIGEFLHRTQGKSLGIVTTADVFDATPAAFAVHTQNRGAGTGICDQYLDERSQSGLTVLMGGGRKWFLPNGTVGSARKNSSDYVLPADLSTAWGIAPGVLDQSRNLINDFTAAGFAYAATKTEMDAAGTPNMLLGLFAFSNMNVSKDKIDGRRGNIPAGAAQSVVADFGFPDQPMLDEMTDKALAVLSKNQNGFVLMVEAASIDKQAHNMDSDRWMLETIEFDRAIGVAKKFAEKNPDTLIIVTADHECAGVNLIGASLVKNSDLITRSTSGLGAAKLRAGVVGNYEAAGFPRYEIAADGYPISTDPDYKVLIGYAGNADRYEDWLTNPYPLQDSQQPLVSSVPLKNYPAGPKDRDVAGGFLITGQVEGSSAVHTGSDIPLSAYGRGSSLFNGVMDNTEVFFRAMQSALGGSR